MTDIKRQTREFAKRWCKANGRNSRHVRIGFAADFAATREKEIAELRAALDAGDAKGEAEVAELQEKCAELQAELHDWRESARKAAGESCGDEVHCACVGPLRHQVVRQAQRIVEDAEEIGCLEKLARLAVSIAEQFERAVESRRPVSGMSVPPSGDFIPCAQLPSAVSRMSWWAREIRRAQTEWTEESEGE